MKHKKMSILVLVFVGIVGLWSVGSYLATRNLEEPSYLILQKDGRFELRKYDSYIVAQVTVTGQYSNALNQGFSQIASYIFGDNSVTGKIAMTAPVLDTSNQEVLVNQSEKIAMTAPVLDTSSSNQRVISFVMPSKYTLDTLPKPNNAAVTFRKVPARTVAALSYTFYTNADRIEKKKMIYANF